MDLLNVAALSALVIVLARPSEIMDPSFLLSFSAVAIIGALAIPWIDTSEPYIHGLNHFADITRDVLHKPRVIQFRMEMRPRRTGCRRGCPRPAASLIVGAQTFWWFRFAARLYLWDLIVISAILQLGMLPSLAYYFHRVILAAPFANIPAVC